MNSFKFWVKSSWGERRYQCLGEQICLHSLRFKGLSCPAQDRLKGVCECGHFTSITEKMHDYFIPSWTNLSRASIAGLRGSINHLKASLRVKPKVMTLPDTTLSPTSTESSPLSKMNIASEVQLGFSDRIENRQITHSPGASMLSSCGFGLTQGTLAAWVPAQSKHCRQHCQSNF